MNPQAFPNLPKLSPEEARERHLRKKYGLTVEDYEDMLAAQLGCCAICGTQEPDGRWNMFHVDHSHVDGHVRALLCAKCNLKLGILENEEWMDLAQTYLENY